jgi:cyclic pyranopterin phosphate synthase
LDTVDRTRYAALTRHDRLDDILAGLDAAVATGIGPIKINAVLMCGVIDREAVPLFDWALERGYQQCFLEPRPLGPADAWHLADMVISEEILASLRTAFTLTETTAASRGTAPAQTWMVDGVGTVGIVASVTRPFCGDCDRERLTADGRLRDCLFAQDETDVLGLLRSGTDDAGLANAWCPAMREKQPGHNITRAGFVQPIAP